MQANMGIKHYHNIFFCMYLNIKCVQPCPVSKGFSTNQTLARDGLEEGTYLLRCPRGTDGLAPSSLWPPPPCCCQLLQKECFPYGGNRKGHKINKSLQRFKELWQERVWMSRLLRMDQCSTEWCSADVSLCGSNSLSFSSSCLLTHI